MAEFVFTSPGVKFKEKELSYVVSSVGLTNLGLVGETMKGPAFEPVYITDKREFADRFGNQSVEKYSNGEIRYQLPYVANSFLNESNQLWVTRVLGLSGYDAGNAWAITMSAGVDPDTVAIDSTNPLPTTSFSGNTYMGVTLSSSLETEYTVFDGFIKTDTTFTGDKHTFVVDTINTDGTGTVSGTTETLVGSSYTEYENMVVAVLRSTGRVSDNVNAAPEQIFNTTRIEIINNDTLTDGGDLFGTFSIEVYGLDNTDTEVLKGTYDVSLNKNSSNYILNVFGTTPNNNKGVWVEWLTPNSIQYYDANGEEYDETILQGYSPYGFGITDTVITADTPEFSTAYKTNYKTPETPWVVSQVQGNTISRLFKLISISDGNSANREIKTSIANINPITFEFDIQVRDFNDTDDNPVILENYTRCNFNKASTNYIGKRIGTVDGEYGLVSEYVMVELSDEEKDGLFPAGFEGYWLNNFEPFGAIEPKLLYKSEYDENERVNKAYLGLSNLVAIDQNLFNFNGWVGNPSDDFVKSKGYHLDMNATGTYDDSGEFEVGAGAITNADDVLNEDSPYFNINTRKFTFVPAGGFDGWNIYRTRRSNTDLYRAGGIYDGVAPNETPMNDFQAWDMAITTYSNPEQVSINLFATPGINWADNTLLVRDTVEMLETDRTDSLYIIDSPDVNVPMTVNARERKPDVAAARDISGMLTAAGIDSNYACTYFPHIQIRDTFNNVNVYIPPTGEVVQAIAYNDNVKAPWWAPAGLNRGVTDAIKSKYKLSQEARNILAIGRINPLTDFVDVGTAIFGQKTLSTFDGPLKSINIRRLLLHAKVLISNVAIRLLFEQNDQTTIDEFKSKVDPLLANIKRERGLQEFAIKMDDSLNTPETRDRNELYGEIYLKPTPAVEKIGITFIVTPSGASFSDLGV
ncbi:MAG: phage tail sheath C-terminal domain-containing protein [bacterium]